MGEGELRAGFEIGGGRGDAEAAAALGEELAAALRSAAGLARRAGHFALAEELEARLAPQPYFRLELFGNNPRLQLELPGEPPRLVAWRLKRAFASLALLALERGRQTSREALVEALWSEESAEAIRRNFHPVLSDLRRTLAEAIAPALGRREEMLIFQLGAYRLEPRLPLEVDVELFEARLAEGESCRRRGDRAAALGHLLAPLRLAFLLDAARLARLGGSVVG